MRDFYSQLLIMNWYIGEGEKRQDLYLLRHVSAELALYAGRLFLAHNRILYPYHKWLMRRLQEASDKPEGLVDAIGQVLASPSRQTAQALLDCVNAFQNWDIAFGDATRSFLQNREWNWRTLRTPLEDRWRIGQREDFLLTGPGERTWMGLGENGAREVVARHRSGVPRRDTQDGLLRRDGAVAGPGVLLARIAGVRISRIVDDLRTWPDAGSNALVPDVLAVNRSPATGAEAQTGAEMGRVPDLGTLRPLPVLLAVFNRLQPLPVHPPRQSVRNEVWAARVGIGEQVCPQTEHVAQEFRRHQLGRVSLGVHAPIRHGHQFVAVAHSLVEVVQDHHHRLALLAVQALNEVQHLQLVAEVQVRGGFVQQQHRCVLRQAHGDPGPLPLSAAQGFQRPRREGGHAGLRQGPGHPLAVVPTPRGQQALMWVAAKPHQPFHGQALGRGGALRQNGEFTRHFPRGQAVEIPAVQQHRTSAGRE
ncbi:hypothetical protein SAMN00790413_01268 [Deinococcus hopiensis KR-140]|uniref:DUF4037 domain-containing protein n=1 Tax=Deinococcus hopiensis KR-140 TaxID=695939 RepID=A0A1W1VEI9_9DEIO|nr:hypothetical protein SAMN00790413_01268 [Deinococcus hopiensis KR-140]